MDKGDKRVQGALYIIASAIIYGCMPLAAKTLYASGMTPMCLVWMRNAFALPVLFGVAAAKGCLKADARTVGKAALAGVLGGGATPLLLFSSYSFIPSGAATTIHYVYPVFVMLLCVLVFRERCSIVKLLCLLLSTAGVALLYATDQKMEPRGFALAFCSGITFAAYTVMIGKSSLQSMHPFQLVLYACACNTLVLLPVVVGSGQFAWPSGAGAWALTVAFAVMVSVGAMTLFQAGTACIGPQYAAILSTFEPITSIVLGVILFSEPFGPVTICGVVCILASVILLTVYGSRAEVLPAKTAGESRKRGLP